MMILRDYCPRVTAQIIQKPVAHNGSTGASVKPARSAGCQVVALCLCRRGLPLSLTDSLSRPVTCFVAASIGSANIALD
jgi:hypothetical protein